MNITGKIMIGNTASAVHILYKDMFGCSLQDVPGGKKIPSED